MWLAGETVQVVCDNGLVHLHHRGVLIAIHARRHQPDGEARSMRRRTKTSQLSEPVLQRPTATAASVTRKVDTSGNVCFAGTHYRAGSKYRRRQVQVAVIGDIVEISVGTELIRAHKSEARPDPRTRCPGQPRRAGQQNQRRLTPTRVSGRYRSQSVRAGTGT